MPVLKVPLISGIFSEEFQRCVMKSGRIDILLAGVVLLCLCFVVFPADAAVSADFTAVPTSGPAPLAVSFTDGSTAVRQGGHGSSGMRIIPSRGRS